MRRAPHEGQNPRRGGGVVIQAAGSIVGGIGVSGAPSGDADEACAKAGIASLRDELEM